MTLGELALAAGGFALGSSAAASLGAYTVSTVVQAGVSEGTAGVLVAFGSVVGLASRIVVGHWSDGRRGSQLDLVSWMLALGGAGFFALGVARGAVLWLVVPLAFATGWAWLGSYNLAMVRLNPRAPGSAVGITQTGAFVGAIVGPAALGFLAERYSFFAAWSFAATASLLAAGIVTILRRGILKEPTYGPRGATTRPGRPRRGKWSEARREDPMRVLLARYRAHAGRGDEVESVLLRMAEAVANDEPGCVLYRAARSLDERDVFVLFEIYRDQEAMEAHRETPHFRSLVEGRIVPILESREREILVPIGEGDPV